MKSCTRAPSRGVTLLELLISLAIGALLLTALGALTSSATTSFYSGRAEAEARQSLSLAMDQFEKAILGSKNILHVNTSLLALSLDPSLDRNGDGIPDVDNNTNGLQDEEVLGLNGQLLSASNLPPDATRDWTPGIKNIDDDKDGKLDWLDINDSRTNNESDMVFSSLGFTSGWQLNGPDWLDVVIFQVISGRLVLSLPVPATSNASWTDHALLENLTVFEVTYSPKGSGNRAMDILQIRLCVSVPNTAMSGSARGDVCALRRWRVGAYG